MLNFISFGSGSSGNCYYLYTESEGLLIDAGVGVRTLKKYFHQYGYSFNSIHDLLITHDHADHIKSVGSLSHDFKLMVHSTQNVHAGIDRNYCVKRKLMPEYKHYVKYGETFVVDHFEVTPFHVPHDSMDNVGYRICCSGMTFVLMTDMGHVTDDMKAMVSEADYLVIEANHDEQMLHDGPYADYLKQRITCGTGHLNNVLCGQTIAECMTPRLKHVWLCHLSEENNTPQCAYDTVAGVLRDKGISVGTDLLLDVLNRKSPTGPYELK